MRGKIQAIVMINLLLSLLIGCGESVNPSEAIESSVADDYSSPVTIRFAWWGGEERAYKTQEAVNLFMDKNPDIIVQTVSFPFETYYENLAISAKAGYMPDVWQGFVGSNNNLMQEGLVEPLDSYIENELIDVADINEGLIESAKIDGRIYGVPLGCNIKCMAIDPAVYQQAGLTVPEIAYASWDDLEADLLELKEFGVHYICDNMFERGFTFEYFCRQRGENVYGTNEAITIAFSKETYVEYYRYKLRWMEEGLTPPYEEDIIFDQEGNEGGKGKFAVCNMYSSQYPQVAEAAGKTMQLLLLPGPDTDKGTDIRPGCHACISAVSKHKEAAARLIDFLVNDVEANRILDADRGMPASSSVRDALMGTFNGYQRAMAQIVELAEIHSSPSSPLPKGNTQEIENDKSGGIFEDMEQRILYGELTPEEAYDIIAQQYGA